MTYTSFFIILSDCIVRCVLLFLEIVALLALCFGISGSGAYFAWFAHSHLLPAMSEDSDISNAREAFFYFSAMTIYSMVVIWGALPYYSIRAELPTSARFCFAAALFATSTALAVFSLRLLFYMKLYWLRFEQAGLVYIANHCRAIVVFVSTLLGVNAAMTITFVSYTIIYGYPTSVSSTLKQMKSDTRKLLRSMGFGTASGGDDEKPTASV